MKHILTRLLRDDKRPWVLLLCLLWLGFMGARYAELVSARSAWIQSCTERQDCPGRRVFLSLVEVVEVGEGEYTVLKVVDEHHITGPTEDLAVGQTVSVIAGFEGEELVEHTREAHPWRHLKVWLSLAGAGLTLLVMGLGFRWDGGLVPRG